MNDALQAPPRSLSRSAAALEKGGQGFTRWALVVVLAGVVLIPPLAAPSLVNFGRSVVRVELMLAEIVVVLGWCLTQREVFLPRRVNRTAGALVGVWVLTSLAATVLAVHVAPAVLRTAEWAVHGLFGLVLWSEMQRDQRVLEAVVRAIPIGFALFVAAIAIEALKMPDPAHHDWGILPYLGHIRRFGIYALTGVTFSAWALLDPSATTRARCWAWAGLTLGWAALIWSGGRGAIGAGFLAGACLWGLAGSRRAAVLKALVGAVVAGALISLCFPVENEGMGLWAFLGRVQAVQNASQFTSGRMELWSISLAAWQQRPWLGLGPDALAFSLNPVGQEQPHNVALQALVDWGLIGAVAFLLLLLGLLLTAVRRTVAERNGALSASRAVAAAYLVGASALGLLDGVFYDARPLLLIAAAAAIALLPIRSEDSRLVSMTKGARLGGVVLGVAALCVAHLATVLAVWWPGVPEPDSVRVTYLKAFPSTGFLFEPASWARAWADEDPDSALAMARWGSRHAFRPWNYLRIEADLLLQQGLRAEAQDLYARANELEAAAYRYRPTPGAAE